MEQKLKNEKKRQEKLDTLKKALHQAQRAVEKKTILNSYGHDPCFNEFLQLTSNPPLYWRPAKHTAATKKMLEDQVALRIQRQKVVAKELELRVQEHERALEEFMNQEESSVVSDKTN